ncbi:putative B3 domain-containing protein Os06g0632500 [Lolium rigidum]|uniref:putative B3 domain-containing protein Os06g0632500 n=1 Tax=Lolium rigidum TaxID=89674 RepID=UPI001F5D8FA8|nr:putative B3 domain-containing protein Os06g0632500 [Lolium rigidum]
MAHSAQRPRHKYAAVSLSPSCLHRLHLPAEFAARLEPGAGEEEREVTVMGPLGKVWRVELRWQDSVCWLGSGWPELAAALGIGTGWSVVLRRERRGVATLSAFDPGCCLARLCTPHAGSSQGVACKNRPRFIKVIQPDDLEKMRIPDKFVQQHLTEAGACLSSQNAMIVCPLGKFWRVKLDHGQSDVLCGDEWPQFVMAHDLSEGNILLFRYEGTNMVFSVEVFLRNGCLKEYHTTLALCTTDGARGPSDTSPQRPTTPSLSMKRKNDRQVVYAISAPTQLKSKPAVISPRHSFTKKITSFALHKHFVSTAFVLFILWFVAYIELDTAN